MATTPRCRCWLGEKPISPARGYTLVVIGRSAFSCPWLFAGSDCGGQRAAVMYSLIVSAKMNDVDPQAWLAHVLAHIAQQPATQLDELLPWNWRPLETAARQAA
jgi:transposase